MVTDYQKLKYVLFSCIILTLNKLMYLNLLRLL